MLFNSHFFIFLFLPLVLFGYYGLRQISVSDRLPLMWLLLASLFFYGWWEARYLLLLALSICVNFQLGKQIAVSSGRRGWLVAGIVFNLGLLAYFKYAWFILDNLGVLTGIDWSIDEIILPLAISFFTFQQITWLVDLSRNKAVVPRFYNYALFVSFFPQLIAGPIVHHAEMMPQFENSAHQKRLLDNLNIGLTLFTLGLFKKIVLADQFALYATPVFDAANSGEVLSFFEAWLGTLAYTLQLYFDFSGYSDMAVGLARMLGIVLPLNFFSPYKAVNIREFWQRWHMTLSRFLRDYLYIPLGGNRGSSGRVAVNIMLTMLIGGLWHGAAWTFVAWGGLHGIYLLLHRFYSALRGEQMKTGVLSRVVATTLTFLAVAIAWVLFRAESFSAAMSIYRGMAGMNGVVIPISMLDGGWFDSALQLLGLNSGSLPYLQGWPEFVWLLAGCGICFFAPNAYQFLAEQRPAMFPRSLVVEPGFWRWRANPVWAIVFAALFTWSVLALNRVSEFLYFQF